MIKITKTIHLKRVLASNSKDVYKLMTVIYPPAYSYLWKDRGAWYVAKQYSKENVLKELLQDKSHYYFVLFNTETIGIIRIIWDEKLQGLSIEKQVKLHRIYLHPKTQNMGLGSQLLNWLEQLATQKKYNVIWLDAMNAQEQAFQFYEKKGFLYHSHCYLEFENMYKNFRKMSQLYKLL
ncbi:GNAT family N-acetyltransferase [Polaribacter tangerinus]|uniref:GNAT family N-acetyltransferase n=1 Tax=Polaribacter tangerinus TaxID=1920034 RepID=UPI000B4B795B|nr:GNAT family N-acetyltransferase [Polaribacter tangerinus]